MDTSKDYTTNLETDELIAAAYAKGAAHMRASGKSVEDYMAFLTTVIEEQVRGNSCVFGLSLENRISMSERSEQRGMRRNDHFKERALASEGKCEAAKLNELNI
tara:strand:+ start:2388 stop:2699 length:312 start_codon:yes stop_codon:yes gene_type:complete